MNYSVKDIEKYIIPEYPSAAREYSAVGIFLISFFGILMAICDPFVPYIFNVIIPIVLIMDIFGILIMINIWKWQKLYTLYSGINCMATSIVLYAAFFKTVYYIIGINSLLLIKVTIGIYLTILIMSNILVLKALKDGYFSNDKKNKKKNKKKFKGTGILVGFSGIGVLTGRLLMNTTNHQTSMVIFALGLLILSYIMTLGTHNIYKYYLLKKYESEVIIYKKDKRKNEKTLKRKNT